MTQIRRRYSADLNVKRNELERASDGAELKERINLKPENDGASVGSAGSMGAPRCGSRVLKTTFRGQVQLFDGSSGGDRFRHLR